MRRSRTDLLPSMFLALGVAACEPTPPSPDANAGDAGASDAPLDAGPSDAGPATPLPTDHCTYAPMPTTARAGGTVTAGAIRVGVAMRRIDAPIGSALGGNTSRAILFEGQGAIDARDVRLSGSFTPSVGIETVPHAKAIAITAGDETMVLLRTDLIFADDTITHEVTERLGPELAGKVLWTNSHSHTAPGSFSADLKFQVGAGPVRARVRAAVIDALVGAAEDALAARAPARIGIATDEDFDPEHHVSYDRRPENDDLFGGEARADRRLAVIRIDRADGTPLAIVPIFGVHSAILDDDVSVFSTDASGAFDHAIEEQFDREVLVMHVQGAAGDVLGESHGHLDFADDEPRWDFARNEECARFATAEIMDAWTRAGADMQDELAMEMVTRSVAMGPDWETFTVREGALAYAPWDGRTPCDREIFGADGMTILSPIDEFNAPGGASLCGDDADPQLVVARLPNTEGLYPYGTCASIPRVTRVLGPALDFDFGPASPICEGTRTTVGAWRLGDYMFAIAPGEPVTQWRDAVVARSPFPVERTFLIGYALGHNGYILTPEDWLRGGFEPTINSWGPLEGEYLGERIVELMALAATDAREDAAAGGADRVVPPSFTDTGVPDPDPAPRAGEIPASVPTEVWMRRGVHPASGQPSATIERVTGVARFVWIGEDPLSGTPRVRLEREVGGSFEPVRRRSGREVEDLDFLVVWTPVPLLQTGDPRTHYWALEWQAVGVEHGALEDRAGLPLGRYRFHVEGAGYTIDSAPFEITRGSIDVRASLEGAAIAIDARYQPREGWRLLDLEGPADRDVPVLAGPLEVVIEQEGGGSETVSAALTGPGLARVTPSGSGRVTRVVVRDRFGNEGVTSL
jgi:neutral ceramidase